MYLAYEVHAVSLHDVPSIVTARPPGRASQGDSMKVAARSTAGDSAMTTVTAQRICRATPTRALRAACTARAACFTRRARCALVALATFGAAALAFACPAQAEELTGTLKKIHDDNVVVLGVREASIPFSYPDGKRTVGYSQTIALQIVDEIRKETRHCATEGARNHRDFV